MFLLKNAKERDSIEEAWQKSILSASGGHLYINPSFANSSSMMNKIGIPGDNTGHSKGNVWAPINNVPMVNVRIPMGNIGVSTDNNGFLMNSAAVPSDNPGVLRCVGGVPWVILKFLELMVEFPGTMLLEFPWVMLKPSGIMLELPDTVYPLHLLSSQR